MIYFALLLAAAGIAVAGMSPAAAAPESSERGPASKRRAMSRAPSGTPDAAHFAAFLR